MFIWKALSALSEQPVLNVPTAIRLPPSLWCLQMAWRCHAANNAGLVEALTANGLITHPRVRQAMLSVERGHFAASKQDVRSSTSQ